MEKIYVYISLKGASLPVGSLWTHQASSSFQYCEAWLQNPESFSLDPHLLLQQGMFHTKGSFGCIADAMPNRWGKTLLERQEQHVAKQTGRAAKKLGNLDYLLGVADISRSGALRFSLQENGKFLSINPSGHMPLVHLSELLAASKKVLEKKESRQDLDKILAPGSSLGGARPKAAVIDAGAFYVDA